MLCWCLGGEGSRTKPKPQHQNGEHKPEMKHKKYWFGKVSNTNCTNWYRSRLEENEKGRDENMCKNTAHKLPAKKLRLVGSSGSVGTFAEFCSETRHVLVLENIKDLHNSKLKGTHEHELDQNRIMLFEIFPKTSRKAPRQKTVTHTTPVFTPHLHRSHTPRHNTFFARLQHTTQHVHC